MRLFTAIIFNDDMKDYLCRIMDMLKQVTVKGSFTARDNLHLTLNFIGETNRADDVREAMIRAAKNSGITELSLTAGGFGRFKRREGDICWIGVKKQDNLWKLQRELKIQLLKQDFPVEDKEYTPHLTLARRAVFGKGFDDKTFAAAVEPFEMKVNEICLMKSERIEGRLTYTRIFGIPIA